LKRLNSVLTGVLVLFLFSFVFLGGCVSQSKYEVLQTNYATLTQEKASLVEELEGLQADYATLTQEKASLVEELEGLQADYDVASTELNEIKEVYPPGDFSSVTELEEWASRNKQPWTEYLDGDFRAALKVQEAGIQDGYLISVMYDEDDRDLSSGWIFNAALVNGALYYWHPEVGEVHGSYAWLVR